MHAQSGRALGITPELVAAILDAEASPLFDEAEKAAIAAAIESTRDVRLSDETFGRLATHFDTRQLVELLVAIGLANLNNRVADAFLVDYREA